MPRLKANAPLITLLFGLAIAVVLFVLSTNAHSKDVAQRAAATTPSTTPATAVPTTSAPTSSAPASSTQASSTQASGQAAPQTPTTYAGSVSGGAGLAIVVRDGYAVVYVCDGERLEAWLHGTARAGSLKLTGLYGARLKGTYTAKAARGWVVAGGHRWSFDLPAVHKPSGLYRAAATVRRAKVVAGWIVLPGGYQVGVASINGKPAPAPKLDPSTGQAVVDGTPVTATPVDGTTR
jgi:hypothetical protein